MWTTGEIEREVMEGERAKWNEGCEVTKLSFEGCSPPIAAEEANSLTASKLRRLNKIRR